MEGFVAQLGHGDLGLMNLSKSVKLAESLGTTSPNSKTVPKSCTPKQHAVAHDTSLGGTCVSQDKCDSSLGTEDWTLYPLV